MNYTSGMANMGQIIRKRRKYLKLQVKELGNKVGVDPVYITQIEVHNKMPSLEVYKKIEKALLLPPYYRTQYFREKHPEYTKNMLTEDIIKQVRDASVKDDPNAPPPDTFHEVDMFFRFKDPTPQEIRAFVLDTAHELNPEVTLNEKTIKELVSIVKDAIKHRDLLRSGRRKFTQKIESITKAKVLKPLDPNVKIDPNNIKISLS
ncbi:MAG: helix-turn-helix transcriptional regulator [Candidatus Omnitrophica bacterium]|nr:helix-turn-helix transcriptional regulator [Candidatus Omnitrophota bacterium]